MRRSAVVVGAGSRGGGKQGEVRNWGGKVWGVTGTVGVEALQGEGIGYAGIGEGRQQGRKMVMGEDCKGQRSGHLTHLPPAPMPLLYKFSMPRI